MKKILIMSAIVLFTIGFYSPSISQENEDLNETSSESYKYDYDDIIIKTGNDNEKIIALTFDDGPDEVFTPQILDILKKYNIKATFFVIGEKVGYHKDLVEREYKEGHEIGNHTFTHANVCKKSYSEIESEIEKTQEAVRDITGNEPRFFRPPYRALNKQLCQIVKSKNMSIVLWSNIDVRDWSNPGVNYIVSTIDNKVKNGNIIILHDFNCVRNDKSQTIQALEVVIPTLQERGYKFVTISELVDRLNK